MADFLEGGLLELVVTEEAKAQLGILEDKIAKIKETRKMDNAYLRVRLDLRTNQFLTAVDNKKQKLDRYLIIGNLEIIADSITSRALKEKAISLHYMPDNFGGYKLAFTSPFAGNGCSGCSGNAGCCGG